ncbi:hypothetical protein ABIB00_007737 [Bradyrhizobium sp. LB14.3]
MGDINDQKTRRLYPSLMILNGPGVLHAPGPFSFWFGYGLWLPLMTETDTERERLLSQRTFRPLHQF